MAGAGPHQENEQQLRLALAMRGGASMAVWIGGAVAEINHVRTAVARQQDPSGDPPSGGTASGGAHPWAALARLAGYDSVDVDVLAGTSAGGMNSALLSASVVYGMRFDAMRRTWVRLADLEAMARPVPKFWQSRPPSLLEGDDYFRAELERAIIEHVPPPGAARNLGDRVDLLLTATLLEPVVQRHFDGRSEPITKQWRQAAFRFHHRGRPGQPLSDYGADDDFGDTALKLAQAARTTSSFPLAFEPARVVSEPGRTASPAPNMYGLFSQVATDPDERAFEVIDGGVLDNIPVTAAINSIANATADRPTDRWLLYLNPDPETPHETDPPRFALPVAATALQAKMGQETLLADIDALDEHNRAVERTRLRRVALFAGLNSTPPSRRHGELTERVNAVFAEHALVRARLDATAVHRLLTQPEEDESAPLVEPVAGDPLVAWSTSARTALREHLLERFGSHAGEDPDAVFDGVHGLLSGIQECLAWAQDIERWAAQPELGTIGRCKERLYRLRTFGQVLQDHADRYWISGARLEPITQVAELDDWVDRVAGRHSRLQHQLPAPVGPLLGAVLEAVTSDDDDDGERFQRYLAEFAAELSSIVDSSGADAASGDDPGQVGDVDAVAEAKLVLDRVCTRLAGSAPDRDEFDHPQQIAHALLEGAEDGERPAVLRGLTVLTAPLDVGRVPGSHIKFLRVVSEASTPLPFTSLRRNGHIATPDKVRGSGLGNFAAFLSAKWRANDWMWGRLDSAASLVPLFVEPTRLVRHSAELGSEGVGDALQALVSRPTRAELDELDEAGAKRWRDFLTERWAEHAGDVRAELDALFAHPAAEHALTETRKAVTERLHWSVTAEELPFVDSVASGADPGASDVPRADEPERLSRQVGDYDVGRQRWRDLDERRMASVCTRFALIAYRACLPGGGGVLKLLGRLGATLIKPLLIALTFAFAAPTRAALVAFLATAAVTFTGLGGAWVSSVPLAEYSSGSPPGASFQGSFHSGDALTFHAVIEGGAPDTDAGAWVTSLPGTEVSHTFSATYSQLLGPFVLRWLTLYDFSGVSFGPGVFAGLVLVVLAAGWLGWQVSARLSHGSGLARWLPALAVAGVLLAAGYWLLTTGLRLGPLGAGLLLMVPVWLATFAYRPSGRALATVVTAVCFALAMWASASFAWSVGGWLLAGTVLSAYGHTVLLGTADVLPPRPRRGSTA